MVVLVQAEDANWKRFTSPRRQKLDNNQVLELFLAGVEKKAFHLARLATGNEDDALEIVQDEIGRAHV